ncbi:hypothetical protein BpHYR1_025740 [Brachionus plicatilis]|uniref:Uncharacterized protein n=1 Tax=Brachionus plicatilis TaxID=10195 RepID=A0A3M7PP08_BRAPC|nr:hypothetical protein BpHYR1_025740 [Brachionus plicatilis]
MSKKISGNLLDISHLAILCDSPQKSQKRITYECDLDSNFYLNRQKLAQTNNIFIKKLGDLKLVSICSLQLAYISKKLD